MKKTVSDIIAAVILVAIVLVVFAGIVYPLVLHYQSSANSALTTQEKQSVESQILVAPVYSYEARQTGKPCSTCISIITGNTLSRLRSS